MRKETQNRRETVPVGGRLLWKLLGIHVLAIGLIILIVWVAFDTLAADYFVALMEKYDIEPVSSHEMFVSAIHRYLIWASLAGLLLTALLSLFLIKMVLGPLSEMMRTTRKIASGDYSGRVPVSSNDELGQLALAFNRMAENLDKIERLRKRMMIDVAHELRTPLTNLKGYLEGLLDGVVPPSRKTFELLQEEAARLAGLVEDVLRLARADAARADLVKGKIKVRDFMEQMLPPYQPSFAGKGIETHMDLPPENTAVFADPNKLSQVIHNLLQNALQYTPAGGKLRISVKASSQETRFLFANSGAEVEEDDLPYIFERFYRGERSRSRELGGAGIGLAIVKEMVEAHGGEVGAELNRGEICIWFSLPT